MIFSKITPVLNFFTLSIKTTKNILSATTCKVKKIFTDFMDDLTNPKEPKMANMCRYGSLASKSFGTIFCIAALKPFFEGFSSHPFLITAFLLNAAVLSHDFFCLGDNLRKFYHFSEDPAQNARMLSDYEQTLRVQNSSNEEILNKLVENTIIFRAIVASQQPNGNIGYSPRFL